MTSGVDLVHDHTFAGVLNTPVYRDLGLPTVVTVHGPVDGDPYVYYRELGQDAHLVAISDRQRALAPDLNWAGRVHNALRVQDWPFQPVKQDYALFLGRFTAEKGPHLALTAAHAVGMPLILAGKCAEPPERRYFDSAVAPLLTEHDHMFGMADAVAKRELLSGAKCLLFPVRWEEPFGMVMIEAMVCGTPVVALRGGAVAEVIVDGVTGRICDHPDELPAAIKEVQDYDPHVMREHVVAHFGADTLGRDYEEIYRSVLRPRTSRRGGRITLHAWSSEPAHQANPQPTRAAGTGPGRATAPTGAVRKPGSPVARGKAAGRTPGTAAPRGGKSRKRASGSGAIRASGATPTRATGPVPNRVPGPAAPPLGPVVETVADLTESGSELHVDTVGGLAADSVVLTGEGRTLGRTTVPDSNATGFASAAECDPETGAREEGTA